MRNNSPARWPLSTSRWCNSSASIEFGKTDKPPSCTSSGGLPVRRAAVTAPRSSGGHAERRIARRTRERARISSSPGTRAALRPVPARRGLARSPPCGQVESTLSGRNIEAPVRRTRPAGGMRSKSLHRRRSAPSRSSALLSPPSAETAKSSNSAKSIAALASGQTIQGPDEPLSAVPPRSIAGRQSNVGRTIASGDSPRPPTPVQGKRPAPAFGGARRGDHVLFPDRVRA